MVNLTSFIKKKRSPKIQKFIIGGGLFCVLSKWSEPLEGLSGKLVKDQDRIAIDGNSVLSKPNC